MNACQIKKYFLICAQCTMARGVGYTEIVEKERDRKRERRVLFCIFFKVG